MLSGEGGAGAISPSGATGEFQPAGSVVVSLKVCVSASGPAAGVVSVSAAGVADCCAWSYAWLMPSWSTACGWPCSLVSVRFSR